MVTIVIGGSGRGVGKTALVCGLIGALPEFGWTAVKITSHGHGKDPQVWEEAEAGQGTDTARYLAAGARRAFLITAEDDELESIVTQFSEKQPPAEHLIFESNRILRHLHPDLCLAVTGGRASEQKPSFAEVLKRMDAMVQLAEADRVLFVTPFERPRFHLASFQRISPQMLAWLRERLHL